MTLQELIDGFNTTPILFSGSGITRRYYNLPNWKELLKHFAEKVRSDKFAYSFYENKAKETPNPYGIMPKIATLIQHDFDNLWFDNPDIRNIDENAQNFIIEKGISPFKIELAEYIRKKSVLNTQYKTEIDKLKRLAKQNISGIITTNYDTFFEEHFEGYSSFVGQDNLVFSAVHGIAEIYKIHGSVSRPDSIVITEQEYQKFKEKGKYLAAKLMTLFMEYPIIFIGYSITDSNIKSILEDIVMCLPEEKRGELQKRFIFVEYIPNMEKYSIAEHSIDLNGNLFSMTKISLSNFEILYDCLTAKKMAIPVKMLRLFKESLYTFVLTSKPGPMMQVADLNSKNINDNSLAISIGRITEGLSKYGLQSIDINMWYKDIVMDDLKEKFGESYDDRLKLAFPNTFRSASGFFPVHKYLFYAKGDYPDIDSKRAAKDFSSLISKTIKKKSSLVQSYKSVSDLWQKEKNNPKNVFELIASLPEDKINVDELELVLREVFNENPQILLSKPTDISKDIRTDIRRLIRIYDFLKWGKQRRPA